MNFQQFGPLKKVPVIQRRADTEPSVFKAQLDALSLLIPVTFAFASVLLSLGAGFAKNEADLVLWGASYGPRTIHEPWRLVSATFLEHPNAMMLLNAVAVFLLGRAISRATNPFYFCLVYLGAGAAGILAATLLHPQAVVFSTSLGPIALVGSLLAAYFFDRRRQPVSIHLIYASICYCCILLMISFRGHLSATIPSMEIAFAFGFAGPFFIRISRQHVLAPIVGTFVILLGLRLAIGSLPASVDRFELDASLASLRMQTAHQLKSIDERFLRGDISDNELAALLNREALAPSNRLLEKMESSRDSSLDPEWLKRNIAELKFRSVSIETIIAVYAAKTNLLEADDLAHQHSTEMTTHLDRFWWGQLPSLRSQELKVIGLGQEYPQAADNLRTLRVGLAKDIRTLANGAAHLEAQNVEDWISHLKTDLISSEARLPSSAMEAPPQADFMPPGLPQELHNRADRIQRINESLNHYLPPQESELQHLTQLDDFLKQMQIATGDHR